MNIKYAKDKYKLEWGEVTQEDILRRIYIVFRTLLKLFFAILNRRVWLCV